MKGKKLLIVTLGVVAGFFATLIIVPVTLGWPLFIVVYTGFVLVSFYWAMNIQTGTFPPNKISIRNYTCIFRTGLFLFVLTMLLALMGTIPQWEFLDKFIGSSFWISSALIFGSFLFYTVSKNISLDETFRYPHQFEADSVHSQHLDYKKKRANIITIVSVFVIISIFLLNFYTKNSTWSNLLIMPVIITILLIINHHFKK
ncbi:MAG: hypothetical protein Q7S01_00025 [bacterium]|nr:hypothetical protein [bacterium]